MNLLFTKMVLVPVVFVALAVTASVGHTKESSGPGYRPDSPDGWVRGWFSSYENRVLRGLEEIEELEVEREQAILRFDEDHQNRIAELRAERSEAPRIAVIRKTRSEWQDEINEANREHSAERVRLIAEYDAMQSQAVEDLRNQLAAPRHEAVIAEMERAGRGTALREQLEIYSAAKNLREVANSSLSNLKANPSDYDQAEIAYTQLISLIRHVVAMHNEFLLRLDQVYEPDIQRVKRAISDSRSKIREDHGLSSELRETELSHLAQVESKVDAVISKLPEIREAALDRIEVLSRRRKDTEHLRRNVAIAGELGDIVGALQGSFEHMSLEMPPLVEYEIDDSDFDLNIRND